MANETVKTEVEETEKDADALKPLIAKYLGSLTEVVETNLDDVEEMRKIYARIVSDRTSLALIETKLNETIHQLSVFTTKRAEFNTVL